MFEKRQHTGYGRLLPQLSLLGKKRSFSPLAVVEFLSAALSSLSIQSGINLQITPESMRTYVELAAIASSYPRSSLHHPIKEDGYLLGTSWVGLVDVREVEGSDLEKESRIAFDLSAGLEVEFCLILLPLSIKWHSSPLAASTQLSSLKPNRLPLLIELLRRTLPKSPLALQLSSHR